MSERILKMPNVSYRAVEMNDVLSASERAEVPARVVGREMKRDSSFCLACFLGFVFLLLASLFVANAAPANNNAFLDCVNMPNYEVIHANWK